MEYHYFFAKKIVEIAKSFKVKKIYTFAGIDIGDARITKKPNLFFAATSVKEAKELQKHKIKKANEGLTISGAAGLIIRFASEEKIEGGCILAETSGKLIYGDFDSAKKVLEYLNKRYDLKIDLKNIKKDAKKITDAFKQVVKELKSVNKPKEENQKLSYIR